MNKYDELALVIASEVRVAIVRELNPAGKSYRQIEIGVEAALRKDISDGSLTWHLEKLKGGRIIEKREDELWYLTDVGVQISHILRLVDHALDIAKEKGIEIGDVEKIHPAKLAHLIFSQLIPELKA